MPTRPLQYCTEPGCPERVQRGRCRLHAAAHERSRPNFEFRKKYRRKPWISVRNEVRQEQPYCPECIREDGIYRPVHDVHHVEKANDENLLDRSNLEALCKKHHSQHTKRGQ